MKKSITVMACIVLMSGCMNKSPESYLDKAATGEQTGGFVNSKVETEEKPVTSAQKQDESKDVSNSGANDLKTSSNDIPVQKNPSQIIKNANVQFQVKDVEASHQKISDLLKQNNSYFGTDNKTTNSYRIDDNMVIRVPSAGFEKLMSALMQESIYTNYKNISAEDVTAEFVDIEARLKTKKEVEQRYIALLKQSNRIPDILEVENNLRTIREEIEAAEGRLKLLKDQVGYSTITLNIYQTLDYTPEPETGFFSNLKEAFVNGWRGLVSFILSVIRVWPFTILLTLAVVFVVRRIRRRRNQG